MTANLSKLISSNLYVDLDTNLYFYYLSSRMELHGKEKEYYVSIKTLDGDFIEKNLKEMGCLLNLTIILEKERVDIFNIENIKKIINKYI